MRARREGTGTLRMRNLNLFTTTFIMVLGCLGAFRYPWLFSLVPDQAIVLLLAFATFCIACSQSLVELKITFRHSHIVWGFVAIQFLIMPAMAFFYGKLFELQADQHAGLVLIGCCPRGIASNLMTRIAKGNVAMSVAMTTVSALIGVAATPLVFLFYTGFEADVSSTKVLATLLKLVLLPFFLGVCVKLFVPKIAKLAEPAANFVANLCLFLIVGVMIGKNSNCLNAISFSLVVSSFALHGSGYAVGILFSRILGFSFSDGKAFCLGMGIQNAALALAIVLLVFPEDSAAGASVVICAPIAVTLGLALSNYYSDQTNDEY